MPMAPLPPLKDPVGEVLGNVPVDVPDPPEGLNVLLMVEPIPEVDVGGPPEREVMLLVPDVLGGSEEEEEMGSAMSNALVWESVVVTSPTGEAWKVYPGPAGTTGRRTVMVPSEVAMVFLKANVLRKISLVR